VTRPRWLANPGLATRLAIAFVAISGIVIVAFAWLTSRRAQMVLRDELGEKLSSIAELASQDEKVQALPYAMRAGADGGEIVRAARVRLRAMQKGTAIGNLTVFDPKYLVLADARGQYQFRDPNMLLRLDRTELSKVWRGQLAYSPVYEGEDGNLYLSAYAPVRVGGEVRLAVGAEASAKFLQRVWQLRKYYTIAGLVMILLSGLLGWLTARTITRPLRKLRVAAERLERGEYGATADVQAGYEVGELAGAFNRMAKMINVRRELLLENMSNGLIAVDQAGLVTEVNRTAEELLGQRRGALEGRTFRGLLPPELAQALEETLAGDEPLRAEKATITGPAGSRTFQVSTSVLQDPDGTTGGAEVSFLDVTEIEQLTAAFETQRRFAAIGEMAAEVAHQIRNPLAAIQGFAELLRADLDGKGKSREYLDDLLKEVRGTEKIVGSFLQYARPSYLELGDVDLNAMCNRIGRSMRPEFDAAGVAVDVAVAPGIPVIRADARSVTQALTNLVRNALDASKRGGRVVLGAAAADGGVRVTVDDDGSGIPPAIYPRLFTPFVTSKAKGTGLGLSLAKKFVEAHGGTIALASRPQGTRAEIWLPGAPPPEVS